MEQKCNRKPKNKINETTTNGKESVDKKNEITPTSHLSKTNERTKDFSTVPRQNEQSSNKKNRYTKNITMVHESRSGGNDTKRFKKATASPLFTVTYRHYSLK